ncbi:MAG TPA: phospholipase A [Burkholderiaceae bacterium]|nr:phospholipase A [Burkholderiaceae bacterium]
MPAAGRLLALLLVSTAGIALAQEPAKSELEQCARLADPKERLACFDRLVPAPTTTEEPATRETPMPPEARVSAEAERGSSLIGERWGIGILDRDSRFDLRSHKGSYLLLARYSNAPNTLPTSPTKPPLSAPLDIDQTEAKFQLSFKVRLADFEHVVDGVPPAALWVGYTQQSHWQVYNPQVSRPFRETNYEPELMLAFFPDQTAFGWRWRLLALGLDHQSNGQSDPLSRSWNRVYLLFGIERPNLGLLIRPWVRINEDYDRDDNPDITRYLGYGDITAVYTHGDHTYSLLGRYNPASGKGAVQAAWSFPLQRTVHGYLQLFSGYGESLIDYNWRQTTIGIGISISDAL